MTDTDRLWKQWTSHTFETYDEANPVENPYVSLLNENGSSYNADTFANVWKLLPSALELLYVLLLPYVLIIIILYCIFLLILQFHMNYMAIAVSLIFILIAQWSYYQNHKIQDHSIKPGIYYRHEGYMTALINHFPLIQKYSKEIVDGQIPQHRIDTTNQQQWINFLPSTPWIFCGHMRTLFPFLCFQIPKFSYQRRWVRVPADDRRPSRSHQQQQHSLAVEAVAVDYFPSSHDSCNLNHISHDNKHNNLSPSRKVLLILAGLTGGSDEGYIRDLVAYAATQGWDSFVMIGRGMANTPLHSQVFFHAARTSDIITCAKIVRESIGVNGYILAVGISMGGIILTNAMVKTPLHSYVDGAMTIAGCHDIRANQQFTLSRRLWQPLLIHGLRQALFQPKHFWYLFHQIALGGGDSSISHATTIVDGLRDLYDWDYIIGPTMCEFESGKEYQLAMCARKEDMLNPMHPGISANRAIKDDGEAEECPLSLRKPFLVIHAADDPIIHVDSSIPTNERILGQPLLLRNHLVIVTKTGGHVGWPVGWTPWNHGFHFINQLVVEFGEAIVQTGKINTL